VRVLRFGLMACASLGLSNCAGGDGSGNASVSRPPKILCQVGPDCDAKWARANEWTAKSGLQIASKSDTQIKTKVPAGYEHRVQAPAAMSDRGELGCRKERSRRPQVKPAAQAHHSAALKLPDLLQRAPSGGEPV